ncbi:MAG: hypothetical protein ACLQME_16735 [Alphaproteobacteria bacterium]
MSEAAITVREVLRLLLEADAYPRLGNADWITADRMEATALDRAETAIASPDDPPQFRLWLGALRKPGIRNDEREGIYAAMQEYFTAII